MASLALQERIRRYYDENQVLYDVFWTDRRTLSMGYGFWTNGTGSLTEAKRNEQRELADRLGVEPADRVLDAGCGIGGLAVYLARERGARVLGLTLSRLQARRAASNAGAAGVGELARFAVADFTRAGLRDGSFDAVVACESVCHAERKEDFLAEAFRVLEPGGRLVVADGFLAREPLSAVEWLAYEEWCRGWVLPGLATVEQFRTAACVAGFREHAFEDRTSAVLRSARRIARLGRVVGPGLRLLRALRLAPASQVEHAVACVRQRDVLASGLAMYGIFTARRAPV